MDDFSKYFEDEKFVRWVYHPDPELDAYWESWFSKNPAERKNAEMARLFVAQLKSREENNTKEEVVELYSQIVGKLNNGNTRAYRRILFPLLRYAAVALIFLSLGVFITYQVTQNQYSGLIQPIETMPASSETQLILADGRKIDLNAKESNVEHEAAGKIVINKKDTLNSNSSSSESVLNQLVVPFGKSSSIRLPDGTLAYLNAGSRLMYPSTFKGKSREVFLVGEGYFEVFHNPAKPFVVKANDLNIVAIGTVFNVSAYPADKVIETVLVQGKVVLRDNNFHLFKKDFVLNPNELAVFNRETMTTNSRQVDVNEYVAWHEGFLNFRSADLSRIIQRVERYYNIKIVLENPMLGSRSITGKLMLKGNQEKVMEVLASTAQVESFRIDETTFGLR